MEAKENNNKKLWFRRKKYGFGWFPVSVEGWIVLGIYILIMLYFSIHANATQDSVSDVLINFAIPFIFFTTVLIIICYKKGETPKWTWGDK